jgi:Defensin propeptide.
MKKLTIIFALLLVVLSAQAAFAQNQNDRENLIKASRFLEEKPFDKNAKKIRAWALAWASETKDVTVVVCGGTASPFLDKKVKFGSELLAQYVIAMTAFKLENPDKTNDENAAQLAGMESALRAYENMLKENPKAKAEKIDQLLAKKNSGELTQYVADADCGK